MGGKCKRMNASMGKNTIAAVRAVCPLTAAGCTECVPVASNDRLSDVYKCQQLSA
jgi:hypothetical protein